jgi:hypothetical protein
VGSGVDSICGGSGTSPDAMDITPHPRATAATITTAVNTGPVRDVRAAGGTACTGDVSTRFLSFLMSSSEVTIVARSDLRAAISTSDRSSNRSARARRRPMSALASPFSNAVAGPGGSWAVTADWAGFPADSAGSADSVRVTG